MKICRIEKLLCAVIIAGAAGLAQLKPALGQENMSDPGFMRSSGEVRDAMDLITDWGQPAHGATRQMLDQYGQPEIATNEFLLWNDKGPWKRIIVYKSGEKHLFPLKHEDVLEQTVAYKVPAYKLGELARFNGSVIVDRTRGLLSARCYREGVNILALNLADDIVRGKRDVANARRFYAHAIAQMMAGKTSPYTQRLQFPAQTDTGFLDQTTLKEGAALP